MPLTRLTNRLLVLPALLITGDTAPVRLREALTSGLPLLHKPVSTDLLFQMLAEVVEPHRQAIAVRQT